MSWTVDGNTYHTWAEYQAALVRRRRRHAIARADSSCREAERIRARMQARQVELDRAGDDLEVRTRLQHEMELDARAMRAIGARMKHLEDEARAAAPEEPAPEIESARAAYESRLAEADARCSAAEAELAAVTARFDHGLAAARQEALDRRQDEASRAGALVGLAEQALQQAGGDLQRLDLHEERDVLRGRIDQARTLTAQNDGAAALALAAGALSDAQALGARARRRSAELAAWRERVLARVASLREALAHGETARYFAPEITRAGQLLDALERRARQGYATYRRLELEADQDDRKLVALEDETEQMLCGAPLVRELAAARTAKATALVGKLSAVYGPVTAIQQRFARAEDRKSPLVVECTFGGARVDLHLDLDGGFTIDGYGHDSNATCSRKSQEVVQSLTSDSTVTGSRVDAGENRSTASTAPAPASWAGIGARLDAIEKLS